MTTPWSTKEIEAFRDFISTEILDFRTRKDIELRGRAGTGTEALFKVGGCCENAGDEKCHCNDKKSSRPYRIQKHESDVIGRTLDSIISPSGLRDLLGAVAEKSAQVEEAVLRRAREANHTAIAAEEAKEMRRNIVREATVRAVLAEAAKQRLRTHKLDAREGGLLATPAGWRGCELNSLTNDTLANLHSKGYAVQKGFLNNSQMVKKVYDEVELLEFETFLRDSTVVGGGPKREDRCMWLNPGGVKEERHPGLAHLLEKLESIAYELNKKCNALAQVPAAYQLSMFPPGKIYEKHVDDQARCGFKFTGMWFPNALDWSAQDGGAVRLHDGDAVLDAILPAGDNLVLLKSQTVAWEVLPATKKRFGFLFYIPAGDSSSSGSKSSGTGESGNIRGNI